MHQLNSVLAKYTSSTKTNLKSCKEVNRGLSLFCNQYFYHEITKFQHASGVLSAVLLYHHFTHHREKKKKAVEYCLCPYCFTHQNLLLWSIEKNHKELTFVEKEKRRTLSLFFLKWFKSCWRTYKWTTEHKWRDFIYRSSQMHSVVFSDFKHATVIVCKAKQQHNKISFVIFF